MEKLTIQAMAKINLGLDVVRRLENGYHQVKMIMQTVDLYDVLTFEKTEQPGIRLQVDKEELPADESNLVYKAARLLWDTYGLPGGINIRLEKKIPMAAGMAGGSTDAAAVFRAVDLLYGLELPPEEMKGLAVKIGADVPYCITGGTALSEGIGEILTPVAPPPACYLVIAKPDIDVSTKYVYENLHVETLTHHPDIDGLVAAMEAKDMAAMAVRMENVLETVTVKKYPVIARIKEFLLEQGAVQALMSGSGPTVFALFTGKEKAETAKQALAGTGLAKQLFVTTFADKGEVQYGEA